MALTDEYQARIDTTAVDAMQSLHNATHLALYPPDIDPI